MFGKYSNIAIRGIVSVVPSKNVENMDCISNGLTTEQVTKQVKLTGIERRRILTGEQTASDLATKAAEELLHNLGWEKDTIKIIVYVTQAPDIEIPSTALLIQKRLGIGTDCLAFDVNLGCSGYVAGIQIVAGLIHEMGGRALLLASDGRSNSKRQNEADYLLFGNAGTATAIEAAEQHGLMYHLESDGGRWQTVYRKLGGPTVMNGTAVFAFAINDVADSIKQTIEYFSLNIDDIDYFVFQQGQKMTIDNLADICGISLDKMLYSLKDYGNTSCASIPLTICNEMLKLKQQKHVRMYLCGFGVGLSWGSTILKMDTDKIYPIIESDFHYID